MTRPKPTELCHACRSSHWTRRGLCHACETPASKVAPDCYEPYDIADSETLAELRRLEVSALNGMLSGAEVGS